MDGKSAHQTKNTTPKPAISLSQPGILQRTCACGGVAGLTGECEECSSKRLSGQGGINLPNEQPTESTQRSPLGRYNFGELAIQPKERLGIQTKLGITPIQMSKTETSSHMGEKAEKKELGTTRQEVHDQLFKPGLPHIILAGETHDELDEEKEKKVWKVFGVSVENEADSFIVNIPGENDQKNDQNIHLDDPYLRILSEVSELYYSGSQITDIVHDKKQWKSIFDRHNTSFIAAYQDLEIWIDEYEKKEVLPAFEGIINEQKDKVNDIKESATDLKSIIEKYNNSYDKDGQFSFDPSDEARLKKDLFQLYMILENEKESFFQQGKFTSLSNNKEANEDKNNEFDFIVQARSLRMYETALALADYMTKDQSIIIKIGQRHMDEIQAAPRDETDNEKVKLLNKKEYKEIFEKLLTEQDPTDENPPSEDSNPLLSLTELSSFGNIPNPLLPPIELSSLLESIGTHNEVY